MSEKTEFEKNEVNLAFLKSNAFYAIIIGSASILLMDQEIATRPWYVSLGMFLSMVSAGFLGIRTVDRTTDKFTGR